MANQIFNTKTAIVWVIPRFFYILIFSISLLIPFKSLSQSLPLSESDELRIYQLSSSSDSASSFTIKPIYNSEQHFPQSDSSQNSPFRSLKKKRKQSFFLLPFELQQQYTSHHPYGWNDGPFILSKGYQAVASTGVFIQYGIASLQLKPEFIFSSNNKFKGFSEFHDKSIRDAYYGEYYAGIDAPEKFGDKIYKRAFWGQSSVRLNFNTVSLGVSTENLWWGPGIYNSLLMSNSAPGFKHISFNTLKPLKTFLGTFEGRIVSGRLEQSGYSPTSNKDYINNKLQDWRYLSAFVVAYSPKWIPGLFIGFDRAFYLYHDNMSNKISDYIPLLDSFEKSQLEGEDNKQRDQLASIFIRWVWEEANAEIYGQFGRNDHAYNSRDLVLEPEHSAGYILGARKIIKLNSGKGNIVTGIEYTHLERDNTIALREASNWYVHLQVRDGYTNQGQFLGAGIGPGSNLLTIESSWYNGMKKLGLKFDSFKHNNVFYSSIIRIPISQALEEWTDYAISVNGVCGYNKFKINGTLQGIRSQNYQWQPTEDILNFQVKLGVTYQWSK
ncbi:MAG TPA: capsule assembly Wzi family protein [Sphingobacteriaceae bacterium]|nr:capsule assembly Wzi family protein [Sphingobacteriaceae bacterium]